MIFKYTSRLIKSTFNRFVAILAIVFIGVSLMMGLRSNYDIMRNSVESYFDEQNLYDIQIYSNFGFDSNDARAIKSLDYVEDVMPSKTRDVYGKNASDEELVIRVLEIENNLNNIELIEGRMPEKDNECLIVTSYNAENLLINDKVSIYFNDGEIKDSFKNTNYTIVGVVRAAENMAKTFTTSLLDNKDLNTVIYIPNANFVSDYYTTVYVKLVDAKELHSFNKEYEAYVDEKAELIEDFSINQSQVLKNKILDDAYKQIEDAKQELEDNRIKYQKELDDAKKQLDDAKKQLEDAKVQIEKGEIEIPENEQKLKDAEAELAAGQAELDAGIKEYEKGIEKLEAYGMSMDELSATITTIYNAYTRAQDEIDYWQYELDSLNRELDRAEQIISESETSSYGDAQRKRDAVDPEVDPAAYNMYDRAVDAWDVKNQYDNIEVGYSGKIRVLTDAINTANSSMQSLTGKGVIEGYNEVISGINDAKYAEAKIERGKNELAAAKKQIENGYAQLEEAKDQLEQGKIDYEKGKIDYANGLKEYEDGVIEFNKEMQDAEDKIEDAENRLADLQEVNWIVLKRYNTNYSFYMYKNNCDQMKSIGTIIPILFFVVAALVCSTTMTRLIDEQRSQIGIYRALGFRRIEILEIYLLYVVIASLAASFIGVFIGILIFPPIIYSTWRLMYDLPSIRLALPFGNLLLCIFSFSVLMMIVTYIVVNGSLKENAAQLLRPKAPKNTKQIVLEKWTSLWNKLPFTSKVTARNLLRYKGRFIMTVVGVAGCTSLLLMGWGIKDSVGSTVALQYEEILKYNYVVNVENDRHIDQMINDIKSDDNNEFYAPLSTYSTNVTTTSGEESAISVVIGDNEVLNNAYSIISSSNNKELTVNDEGVIITEKFADTLGLSVGDEIGIESSNGIQASTKINGIAINYVSHYMYMSDNLYTKLFNEEIEYNNIAVSNNTDPSKLLKLADEYKDINNVADFTTAILSFNNITSALNLIIIVIIVVAGALAFVVLINLTNVNISERIREIATLKVLGFKENEVDAYIFKEVFLMSLIGAIIGLPLGFVESKFVMSTIEMDMCMFPHIVHPISYLYAFIITIIFTCIVLLLTRRTLRKVEMVESLKSIE